MNNGIDDEPTLRLYFQDPMPPSTGYEHRPGHWISEPSWLSPNVRNVHYSLTTGLSLDGDEARWTTGRRKLGESAYPTFPMTSVKKMAARYCSNKPVAMFAARLCEVLSSGQVTRLTYGTLNLTHRNSNAQVEPLQPGRRYWRDIDLERSSRAIVGNRGSKPQRV